MPIVALAYPALHLGGGGVDSEIYLKPGREFLTTIFQKHFFVQLFVSQVDSSQITKNAFNKDMEALDRDEKQLLLKPNKLNNISWM